MKFIKILEHNGEIYKVVDTISVTFDTGVTLFLKNLDHISRFFFLFSYAIAHIIFVNENS